jgi:hypothetical protein
VGGGDVSQQALIDNIHEAVRYATHSSYRGIITIIKIIVSLYWSKIQVFLHKQYLQIQVCQTKSSNIEEKALLFRGEREIKFKKIDLFSNRNKEFFKKFGRTDLSNRFIMPIYCTNIS